MRAASVAVMVLATAGCASGTPLEHEVVGTVAASRPWETSVTADPEAVAQGWSDVGGTPVDLPDGHVALLLTGGGMLRAPEVTSVRDHGGTWTVGVVSGRLAPGCSELAVVTSVTFLVHVRADAPPTAVELDVDERRDDC